MTGLMQRMQSYDACRKMAEIQQGQRGAQAFRMRRRVQVQPPAAVRQMTCEAPCLASYGVGDIDQLRPIADHPIQRRREKAVVGAPEYDAINPLGQQRFDAGLNVIR